MIKRIRTKTARCFDLYLGSSKIGFVEAEYVTPTQFHWKGKALVRTNESVFFSYSNDNAASSTTFVADLEDKLQQFLIEHNATIRNDVSTSIEDRKPEFKLNKQGKRIALSDLVKEVKLPTPRVTTLKLSDYSDVDPIAIQAE